MSHAFHTSIVAPATVPFVDGSSARRQAPTHPGRRQRDRRLLPRRGHRRADHRPPRPAGRLAGAVRQGARDALRRRRPRLRRGRPQAGAAGFVEDVLGRARRRRRRSSPTTRKLGDDVAFNQALCGLYAAGIGAATATDTPAVPVGSPRRPGPRPPAPVTTTAALAAGRAPTTSTHPCSSGCSSPTCSRRACDLYAGAGATEQRTKSSRTAAAVPPRRQPAASPVDEPVVITGAALGLPGAERVFDDDNVARILAGRAASSAARSRSDPPSGWRDMHITPPRQERVRRRPASRRSTTRPTSSSSPARHAPLDVVERVRRRPGPRRGARHHDPARDRRRGSTRCATPGSRSCMRYKTTTLGTQLPDRWGLPEALRDDTGVIFASRLPRLRPLRRGRRGATHADRGRREHLLALEGLRARCERRPRAPPRSTRRIAELRRRPRARAVRVRPALPLPGPVDGPLAVRRDHRRPRARTPRSTPPAPRTTQALSLAEDWIRAGRCRRVVVVSARRRHRRRTCCRGSAPASSPRAPPRPTSRSRTPRRRSTVAATA